MMKRIIIIFLIIIINIILSFCDDINSNINNSDDIIIEEEPNGIPLNIHILLIGFDSNGAYEYKLEPETLKNLLIETYPIHYVHSIFESDYLKSTTNNNADGQYQYGEDIDNKRLMSHYDLKYYVHEPNRISLDRYEQILQVNMKQLDEQQQQLLATDGETHTISINLLESYFESEISKIKFQDGSSRSLENDYTIIILNPSKERILTGRKLNNGDKTLLDKFKYQFSNSNGEILSACWIGSSRYIVIDLSAGPLKYGTTLHKSSDEYYSEGSIDHNSIPKLIEYFLKDGYTGTSIQGASPIEISAHISTMVISSIKNVFLFDSKFNYIPLFQKVLVPILIFKDIQDDNTPTPENLIQNKFLNIKLIKNQIKRLFPFSNVEFVIGEHSIHEHKHISMAFSKSIRSHSSFEMDPLSGKFKSNVKHYLDSKELLLSLKYEDDILASGLIGNDVTQLPMDLRIGGGGASTTMKKSSKILPIYIFTLLNSTSNHQELLLDKYHSFASNQDAVIVLQTNNTYNSTFYKGNIGSVRVNSLLSGTRNVIAGIASSQGLMGPTLHYSEVHNRLINNFLWSFGYNPFNLFLNSGSQQNQDNANDQDNDHELISQIFIDGIIRNTIITSIQSTEQNLKLALHEITNFSSKYLIDSLGFEIQDISMYKGNFIIDRLYHTPPSKLPILKSIVQRLHNDLEQITIEITNQIKSIPSYLNNNKELNKQQKDKISQDLVLIASQVSGFLDYVHKEIASVESQLLCCAITRGRPINSSSSITYLNLSIVIVAIIISIFVVKFSNSIIGSSSNSKKKPLLINRRSKINTN